MPDLDLVPNARGYWLEKELPDGRVCAVGPQLWGAAQVTAGRKDRWEEGHDEQWMYSTGPEALMSFSAWDGAGEPQGWVRHMPSGRRREEADAARETVRR